MALDGVTAAEAGVLIVTLTDAEVPVHPAPSVTITLYEPGVDTVMLCVVCPLLHT